MCWLATWIWSLSSFQLSEIWLVNNLSIRQFEWMCRMFQYCQIEPFPANKIIVLKILEKKVIFGTFPFVQFLFWGFWNATRLWNQDQTIKDYSNSQKREKGLSWPYCRSRSLHLHCLAKGVFSPIPSDCGYFVPSQIILSCC